MPEESSTPEARGQARLAAADAEIAGWRALVAAGRLSQADYDQREREMLLGIMEMNARDQG